MPGKYSTRTQSMAQQIIDVGNVANDGQGDPLRTAFIKTNQNFTELYNAGGVSGIANGSSNITIAEDSTINMAVAGVNDVVIVDSTGLTVNGLATANIFSAVGNIYSPYYFGNGSTLTGLNNQNANSLTGTTLSANVVNSSLTSLGNLTLLNVNGNVNVIGNVVSNARITAANIVSNNSLVVGGTATFGGGLTSGGTISTIGNVVANSLIGNIEFASLSTPGNVIGGNVFTVGQVSAAGNVIGNFILGNGSFLTGIAGAYSNADVANFLPTYTGALAGANLSLSGAVLSNISTAGNITGGYLFGNGSLLTGVVATDVGTLATLSVTGNANIGNVNAVGNVNANTLNGISLSLSGNLISPLSTTQNITTNGTLTANIANINTVLNMAGNINMQFRSIEDVLTANALTYLGGNLEITDHAYVGTDLSSGFPAGNVIWSSANITANANINANNAVISNNATINGIVSTLSDINAGGNISAVGNLLGGNITSFGLITAASNVNSNNINVVNVANVGGNLIAGNVEVSGIVSSTGNVVIAAGSYFVGNLIGNTIGCIAVPGSNTAVLYNLNGNVDASSAFTFDPASDLLNVDGTICAVGAVSVLGNIVADAGNFFIGNGSLLTGISANLSNVLSSLSVTGNINTSNLIASGANGISLTGNLQSTGGITTTGNVLFGNISVTGAIDSTNYFGGNLFLEDQLSAGTGPGNIIYSTGNVTADGDLVGNNLSVSNIASVSGNITGGNINTAGLISATGNATAANIRVSTGLLLVASLGSDPAGVTGAIYFNTGNSKFRGYDGTNWTNLN